MADALQVRKFPRMRNDKKTSNCMSAQLVDRQNVKVAMQAKNWGLIFDFSTQECKHHVGTWKLDQLEEKTCTQKPSKQEQLLKYHFKSEIRQSCRQLNTAGYE
uniref:Uncharacterized protein n=1 Tax=Romanomermis culicivorax TaxID=13658 RepID=A0A915JAL1_ROMCU